MDSLDSGPDNPDGPEVLKRWRHAAGLSTEEACQILSLNSSRLAGYERGGISKVPLRDLVKFVRVYRVNPVEFQWSLTEVSDQLKDK